jgi:hypothetical protein
MRDSQIAPPLTDDAQTIDLPHDGPNVIVTALRSGPGTAQLTFTNAGMDVTMIDWKPADLRATAAFLEDYARRLETY